MIQLVSGVLILIFFSSCTISMTCSNSGGSSTDQVDGSQSADGTVNPNINIPLK